MDFKKIISIIMSLMFFLLPLSSCKKQHDITDPPPEAIKATETVFRGVWLSCYELSGMLSDGSETAFRSEVEQMLTECSNQNINVIFLQVRPFADSVYPSEIFPVSEYILSSSGQKPDFDVLSVFIELAEIAGVEVHAWINPYRISYKTELSQLNKDTIAFNRCIKTQLFVLTSAYI